MVSRRCCKMIVIRTFIGRETLFSHIASVSGALNPTPML